MPARIRPTVPYKGTLPHREHRSKKGRRPDHHLTRNIRKQQNEKIQDILEAEIEEEIQEIKEQ